MFLFAWLLDAVILLSLRTEFIFDTVDQWCSSDIELRAIRFLDIDFLPLRLIELNSFNRNACFIHGWRNAWIIHARLSFIEILMFDLTGRFRAEELGIMICLFEKFNQKKYSYRKIVFLRYCNFTNLRFSWTIAIIRTIFQIRSKIQSLKRKKNNRVWLANGFDKKLSGQTMDESLSK